MAPHFNSRLRDVSITGFTLKRHQLLLCECRWGVIAGAVLHLAAVSSPAQEALRTAVEGDQAYRTRNAADYRPSDQLKAGPVYLNVGLSCALDWNDTIR